MPQQNVIRFQESLTKELTLVKDRVRDLIGDANWGIDGGYKEAILRKTISQFLPFNLSIGTGFILGNNDHYFGQLGTKSTQLDIIIYENTTPVIFREGDFVIITETAVRAVIEVKTKITNYSRVDSLNGKNSLNKIIRKIDKLREFDSFNPELNQHGRKKFIGIFSYEYEQNFMMKRLIVL